MTPRHAALAIAAACAVILAIAAIPGGHHAPAPARTPAPAPRDDGTTTREAVAIAQVRDPARVPDLLELARGAHPVIVRANALRALAAIGAAVDVRPLVEDAGTPVRVRVEAALALRRLGRAQDIAPLGTLLDDATLDRQVRLAIVQALSAIGGAGEILTRERARADATERAFLAASS